MSHTNKHHKVIHFDTPDSSNNIYWKDHQKLMILYTKCVIFDTNLRSLGVPMLTNGIRKIVTIISQ